MKGLLSPVVDFVLDLTAADLILIIISAIVARLPHPVLVVTPYHPPEPLIVADPLYLF